MDEMNTIIRQIEAWLDQGEIAGASLIIRKNGNIIMDGHFGYADLDRKIPVTRHSIYRMMSMGITSCVPPYLFYISWSYYTSYR